MKKISLKTVKEYLNRDEMRMVKGGSGAGNCAGSKVCHNTIDCNEGCGCYVHPSGNYKYCG